MTNLHIRLARPRGGPDWIALKRWTLSAHTRRAHIASQAISNGVANLARDYEDALEALSSSLMRHGCAKRDARARK
jgi:hypothetical protein